MIVYWICVAVVVGVCIFLAGMIVGVWEARKILERPSPIEWKLSEEGGVCRSPHSGLIPSHVREPSSESFYDVSRSSLAMYRERRAALSGKGGRPGVGPSDSQPAPHVFDWKQEAVFIRPPTGPDLLVLDLQERTRT
jgi:hypothetical protein